MGKAGFVGMLLLCLFVLSPYCQAMKMDGQWYWQEDLVHTEDVPEERVVQEAVAGKGDWKPFRVPGQPPVAKNTQYVWLMTTMPAEPIHDATLLFNVTDQSFELWLDDQKIYSYGDMQSRGMSYGQRWHLVTLPKDYEGKKLLIRTHSDNPFCLGNFSYIQLDSSVMQMASILRRDIPYIANIPLGLFMICIMLMYYMSPTAPKSLYTQIILFMISFDIWMMCVLNTKQLLLDAPVFWWFLLRINAYLLPILANLIIYRVIDRKYRRRTWKVVLAFTALFLLVVLAEIFGFHGLDAGASVFYIMLPVLDGCVAYWTIRSAIRGNYYCRAMLLPLVVMLVAGTLDGFFGHFYWLPESGSLLPYGTFTIGIFLLYIIRQQIRRERSLAVRAAGLADAMAEAVERSETDRLTHCYNRNRLEAVLAEQARRHREEAEAFSLIMLDIDFFKRINDTYGHDAGDEVLASFAGLIRDNIKKSDVFVRWGGEEFILVCCGCSGEEALLIAERLRRQVAHSAIFPQQRITCSVGVTSWQGGRDTVPALLKRVDQALYTAKRKGRNRVCQASENIGLSSE